jgi:hypothetical protein
MARAGFQRGSKPPRVNAVAMKRGGICLGEKGGRIVVMLVVRGGLYVGFFDGCDGSFEYVSLKI